MKRSTFRWAKKFVQAGVITAVSHVDCWIVPNEQQDEIEVKFRIKLPF